MKSKIEDLGLTRDTFPEKLKNFRAQIMGWSQERLARELGVTARTISRWEAKKSIPREDSVIRNLVSIRFLG